MYIIKCICKTIHAQKGGFMETLAKPVQTLGGIIGVWERKIPLVEWCINTTSFTLSLKFPPPTQKFLPRIIKSGIPHISFKENILNFGIFRWPPREHLYQSSSTSCDDMPNYYKVLLLPFLIRVTALNLPSSEECKSVQAERWVKLSLRLRWTLFRGSLHTCCYLSTMPSNMQQVFQRGIFLFVSTSDSD